LQKCVKRRFSGVRQFFCCQWHGILQAAAKEKPPTRGIGGKLDREASTRIKMTLEKIPMAGIVY